MIRPTRATREALATWADPIFAMIAAVLILLILLFGVEPAIVAFFTRCPA